MQNLIKRQNFKQELEMEGETLILSNSIRNKIVHKPKTQRIKFYSIKSSREAASLSNSRALLSSS
jgi:DNA-directed RNA polymerase subunit L